MAPHRLALERLEHEHRYLLERGEVDDLLERLCGRLILDRHHSQTAAAYSRTTYLDTDDLEYLNSGERSIARRVRVREYAGASTVDGAPVLDGHSFLELKESAGQVRNKRRLAAPSAQLWHAVSHGGEGFGALCEEQGPWSTVAAQLADASLRPRMTTWYRRWSLHAPSAPVRLTIDEGLAFCKPSLTDAAEPSDVVSYGPGRVVEIKYRGTAPAWLNQALAGMPEAQGFSKFSAGMDAMRRAGLVPIHRTRPLSIPEVMAPR